MPSPIPTLVTFAVREEAAPFLRRAGNSHRVRTLLTGMGAKRASEALHRTLEAYRPACVIGSGFAGGLSPRWRTGAILYAAETAFGWLSEASRGELSPATFYCTDRVVVTREEKTRLFQNTGADAVGMESESLHQVCQTTGIPFLTLRVILDSASESLPLDFNRFLGAGGGLKLGKLTAHLLLHPATLNRLLNFRRRVVAAAERLAEILARLTGLSQ